MEHDRLPIRRLVLLAASLAAIACGLLPGVAAAAPLSAGPTSLLFGAETVGAVSASKTVTISNPDPGAAQILGVSVTGPGSGSFSITGDGCSGKTLEQGEACAIEAAFAPTAGGPATAGLQVAVEGEPTIELAISGTGQTRKLSTPASAAFPTTSIGGASTEKIALKNESEAGVNVNQVKVEGVDTGDFAIEGGNCVGFISPGMGCELTVRFSPTASGPREALLRVSTDAIPSDYVTALTGEGATPELTFEPGQYDFGLVEVRSGGPRANLTLRNSGAAAVQLSNLQITGPGAGEFWIPGSGCWGTTLAAGASCTVEVQFNANEEGGFTAALSVDVGATTFQAPLTARAERPKVEVSPAPLAFGPTTAGARQVKELTLTNTGNLPVGFFIALVSGGDISSFHLLEESCTSNLFSGSPRIIEPGGSCMAKVAFEPTDAGAKAATLSFFGSGEGALQVPVEGEAVAPQLSLAPGARGFGAVGVGTAGPVQSFELRNESGDAQTIDSATLTGPDLGEFQIRSDDCSEMTLDPGATCAVAVRFAPQSSGPKTATLRLRGTGGTMVAGLSGEGTATPPVAATYTKSEATRGHVALDLLPRPRPAAGGVTIGRARCVASTPCELRLSGLAFGHLTTQSGPTARVHGLPISRFRLAPGASAVVTTDLPQGFHSYSAGARLRVSLRWRTGSARGASGHSYRLG